MRINPRALARNRAAARPLSIEASADEATVWIYDFIGYDEWTGTGVSAEKFAKEVSAINAPTIRVRINSPGGSVFDGRAIHAALKNHPAKVIASIEGLAASAATFIAMAADEVEISSGSMFMIHNAWTLAYGNAEELLATAALLEKIDGTLVADYVAKTGATDEQVRAWMAAETFFTAEEALAAGFVDRVTAGTSASAAWNPAEIFGASLPEQLAPEPAAEPTPHDDAIWQANDRRQRLLDATSA